MGQLSYVIRGPRGRFNNRPSGRRAAWPGLRRVRLLNKLAVWWLDLSTLHCFATTESSATIMTPACPLGEHIKKMGGENILKNKTQNLASQLRRIWRKKTNCVPGPIRWNFCRPLEKNWEKNEFLPRFDDVQFLSKKILDWPFQPKNVEMYGVTKK